MFSWKQNFHWKAHNDLHKIFVQIFVTYVKIVRGTSSEPWKTPDEISFYMTHFFPYAFQLPPMFLIWKLNHHGRFYQAIYKWSSPRCVGYEICETLDKRHPAGTQHLYNVSFRTYLRYVIYERLHNVVTTFVNERCFTYV